MTRNRRIGTIIQQGHREGIAYGFDWQKIGAPSNPEVFLEIESTGEDVSTTFLTGLPSVLGTVVTTPLVGNLTPTVTYRLTCVVDIGTNTYDSYIIIIAER